MDNQNQKRKKNQALLLDPVACSCQLRFSTIFDLDAHVRAVDHSADKVARKKAMLSLTEPCMTPELVAAYDAAVVPVEVMAVASAGPAAVEGGPDVTADAAAVEVGVATVDAVGASGAVAVMADIEMQQPAVNGYAEKAAHAAVGAGAAEVGNDSKSLVDPSASAWPLGAPAAGAGAASIVNVAGAEATAPGV